MMILLLLALMTFAVLAVGVMIRAHKEYIIDDEVGDFDPEDVDDVYEEDDSSGCL